MGYTTTFEGKFALDKLPPAEVIVRLRELEESDGREGHEGMPGSYNQWVLTKDCRHIEWDGGEKFYEYVPWLQFILNEVLKPAGITLTGSVNYSGEDSDDNGVIVIENGKVKQIENSEIGEALQEMHEFKKFVESQPGGRDIIRAWELSKVI